MSKKVFTIVGETINGIPITLGIFSSKKKALCWLVERINIPKYERYFLRKERINAPYEWIDLEEYTEEFISKEGEVLCSK